MKDRSLMLFAPSAYPLGGVATWLAYLLPGLRERGWRPILALTQGRWHDPGAYFAVHPYAPIVPIGCGAGTQASRVRAAELAILQAKPDIVASVNLPDALLAAARLRGRGRFAGKTVAIEHGMARETLIDMRGLAPWLDALVGANRLTCALAQDFTGLAPSRVFYAPCGAAARNASAPLYASRSRKTLTLIYAGRLEAEQKRIFDLPELALELSRQRIPFRLLIAGGGPEEGALRRRLGEAKEVQFLGVLEGQSLCETVLPQADALLVLSNWETGPIVAWEAMAAGVPLVCSRYIGSGAEQALIDGQNCLMFPVGDMRAAAEAIGRLRDQSLAAKLSEAGAALAGARYSRTISIARWDEVFREILTRTSLPATLADKTLRPAGRLDRWFGTQAGDTLRRVFGLAYKHTEPGGEWPHLLSRSEAERELFDGLIASHETRTA